MTTFVRIISCASEGRIWYEFAPRRMVPEIALIELLQARNIEQGIEGNPKITVVALMLSHGSV
jgi:hypothetical protein